MVPSVFKTLIMNINLIGAYIASGLVCRHNYKPVSVFHCMFTAVWFIYARVRRNQRPELNRIQGVTQLSRFPQLKPSAAAVLYQNCAELCNNQFQHRMWEHIALLLFHVTEAVTFTRILCL